MDGRQNVLSKIRVEPLSAMLSYAKLLTKNCLRGGGAKKHDDLRLQQCQLGIEPGLACRDLTRSRPFVKASLPRRRAFPLEMFYDVRNISGLPLDAGFDKRFIQQTASGPNERMPAEIFLIARLFTDQNDLR